MSGFVNGWIRRRHVDLARDIARDPGDGPAVDLHRDLLEDDLSRVDAVAWLPPEPPPQRSRDLIHPA
jgi:hypothetical protein